MHLVAIHVHRMSSTRPLRYGAVMRFDTFENDKYRARKWGGLALRHDPSKSPCSPRTSAGNISPSEGRVQLSPLRTGCKICRSLVSIADCSLCEKVIADLSSQAQASHLLQSRLAKPIGGRGLSCISSGPLESS